MNVLLILAGWPWIAVFIGVGVCLAIRERDKQIPIDSPAAQPEPTSLTCRPAIVEALGKEI